MGWLDDWQKAIAPAEVLPQPAPKPRAPRAKREVHPVFVQVGSCLNGDAGAVEVHFYTVDGDMVTLTERNGKSLGKSAQIYEGQTAQTTARVMARALSKEEGNFNRKIEYGSLGFA